MTSNRLIAITGGIGTGKSIVSNVLRQLGYEVYDCDLNARRLMDCSREIKDNIAALVAAEAIVDNAIDREALSRIVFSDKAKLERLNSIVHGSVREDIARWRREKPGSRLLFVETAILYQSELDLMVDAVWEVVAPEEIRVERVMKRNGLDEESVMARIKSQDAYEPDRRHESVSQIINDGCEAVLPQLLFLLERAGV